MIQMEHSQAQIPSGSEFAKDMEEADGIGSAGDGDRNLLAGFEHPVSGYGGSNSL
jgi:hypothetical protein